MKILFLWYYVANSNYDHYLGVDFATYMSVYPGIQLMGYGLDFELGYPDLAPLKYKKDILLSDIYKEFEFDVIIVETKGRSFKYYDPHNKIDSGTWFPVDFALWNKTPKIIIDHDYHYETDDLWYKEMGFDLILQRHYSQSLRQQTVPMKFFPFSVDTSLFNPWKTQSIYKDQILELPSQKHRIKKLCFTGHDIDKAYILRRTAKEMLIKQNLLADFSGTLKTDGQYIKILREYVAYVSCGSIYNICAAKNFEIISSGGVLFTNKFLGIEKLLPENCYVSYKEDLSDVIQQAKKIINEPEYTQDIVNNGRIHVNKYHTHEHRIAELLEIIKELK